jgi:hypothetical protein
MNFKSKTFMKDILPNQNLSIKNIQLSHKDRKNVKINNLILIIKLLI